MGRTAKLLPALKNVCSLCSHHTEPRLRFEPPHPHTHAWTQVDVVGVDGELKDIAMNAIKLRPNFAYTIGEVKQVRGFCGGFRMRLRHCRLAHGQDMRRSQRTHVGIRATYRNTSIWHYCQSMCSYGLQPGSRDLIHVVEDQVLDTLAQVYAHMPPF